LIKRTTRKITRYRKYAEKAVNMRKTSLICIIQIAGKAIRNEAGWSIQADFFADIPENPFWGNQEAKTSESRQMPG